MTKLRRGVALLLAVMTASALCCSGVRGQEVPKVVAVEVSGNQNISTAAILAAVGTKVGEPFSEDQIERDLAAIRGLGYFTGDVTDRVEDVPGGKRVVFVLAENPRISRIDIVGNTAVGTKEILDAMQTKVGEVLNTQTLSKDVEAIVRVYGKAGFPAEVTDVGVDEEGKGILTIKIMEARIEAIRVVGLKKTKEYVVLRELRVKPGDLYNAPAISKDITRVLNLELFEDVSARPDPGSAIGQVVLTINITERKTGQVILGFGYSNREGLVGRAELSESNFRGKGQGVNFTYEIGGRANKSSFEVGFFEPWVDKRHTSLSTSIYDKIIYRFQNNINAAGASGMASSADYYETRKGGTVQVGRPIGEYNRLRIGFRGEAVTTHLPEAKPPDPTKPPQPPQPPLPIQNGTIYSGTLEGIRDTRDYVADPTTGMYVSLSGEPGQASMTFDPALPDFTSGTFAKFGGEYRRYFPVFSKNVARSKRRVLAMRLVTRMETGLIPFFEQQFVGGAETLRGYTEDRFWGRRMLLASVEARVPVASNLQGVVFLDAGDAWGAIPQFVATYGTPNDNNPNALPQSADFKLHLGYGIGMRVRTPIGPIRLDYGFGDEGSRLHFSIGQVF